MSTYPTTECASAAHIACPASLLHTPHSTCRPFVGPDGRVFAVAAGRPCDASFDSDHDEVCNAMLAAGQATAFTSKQMHHKRGDFPAINVGVTHGRGTVEPKCLRIDPGQKEMVEGLLGLASLKRMALFANGAQILPLPPSMR